MFTKVWPLQFIKTTGNRIALLQTAESQWHLMASVWVCYMWLILKIISHWVLHFKDKMRKEGGIIF